MQDGDDERRVAPSRGGVDVSSQVQYVPNAGRVLAGYGVVEEAVFTGVLGVNVLSFQGLSETNKVPPGQEGQNIVLFQTFICGGKRKCRNKDSTSVIYHPFSLGVSE